MRRRNNSDDFWNKVEQTNTCWMWKATKTYNGYGYFYTGGETFLAHRYAYLISNGELPVGMYICHKCDNPSCVNPEHLYAGTQKDNMSDRESRGRTGNFKGSAHPGAKLVEDEVSEIRELYATGKYTQNDLARLFSVSVTTVSQIITRRVWKHI